MAWPLRQSTAGQIVPLGPFVSYDDDTDNLVPSESLVIAASDIRILKAGASAEVGKNNGGATHIASGRYRCTLDAADTDTLGPMRIAVSMAGALDEWIDCCVYPTAVYDALYAGTGAGVLAVATNMRGTDGAYTGTPPAAAEVASQVRTELAAELARIDATISSRLAAESYAAPDNASTAAARSAAEAAAILLDALTEIDSEQLRFTAGALANSPAPDFQFAPEDIGAIASAVAGAVGNVEIDTEQIVRDILSGLGSVQITRIGPEFDPVTSTVTLIAGDDYLAANGSALTFALTLPDIDLTGARAVFSAERTYHPLLPGSAELIDTDTDAPKLRLQWTRAQTLAKPSDRYSWGAAIIDAAGLVKTIIGGPLILKPAAVNPAVVSKVLEVSG